MTAKTPPGDGKHEAMFLGVGSNGNSAYLAFRLTNASEGVKDTVFQTCWDDDWDGRTPDKVAGGLLRALGGRPCPGLTVAQMATGELLNPYKGRACVITTETRRRRGELHADVVAIDGAAADALIHEDHPEDHSFIKCRYLVDLKMYDLGRELHRHLHGGRDNRPAILNSATELKEKIDDLVSVALNG